MDKGTQTPVTEVTGVTEVTEVKVRNRHRQEPSEFLTGFTFGGFLVAGVTFLVYVVIPSGPCQC